MKPRALVLLTIASAWLASPQPAFAQSSCQPPCLEMPGWQAVNRVQLHVASQRVPPVENESFEGDLRFEISGGRVPDLRVDVDLRAGPARHVGTALVVSGRVLAFRGPIIEDGHEWEGLEGWVLMLRLTRQLLGRAFPQGPRAVSRRSTISLRDDQQGFRVGGNDYMDVLPPWSLTGSAESQDGRRVNFEMQLMYGTAQPGQARASGRRSMRLVGQWLLDGKTPPLPDGMSLVGWKVVLRDTPERTFKTGGATPYTTIGRLRGSLLTR